MHAPRLKMGIIGCGQMGHQWAEKIREEGRADVVAVSDISGAARVLGGKLGVPWYDGHGALLAQKDLDAVLIATPNITHEEIAIAAAMAGKHILLEKAMAVGVKACDAILEAAAASGVKLMVGHTHRFHPPFAKVWQLVQSGELGEPRMMDVIELGTEPLRSWWGRKGECGGMLYWQGCHEFDYMGAILGNPVAVYASAPGRAAHEADYIDTASVNVRFSKDRSAHFVSSFVSAINHYSGRILLSEGAIFYGESPICIRYQRLDGEEKRISSDELEAMKDGFILQLERFLDYLLEDAPAPVSGEDGRQCVALIDASYQSIDTSEVFYL